MHLLEATWRKNAKFLIKMLVKQNNRNNSGDGNNKGARALRPFGVAVNAVVSVVLFDQNLDQKFDPDLDQAIASREKNPVKSCDPKGGHQEGGPASKRPAPLLEAGPPSWGSQGPS